MADPIQQIWVSVAALSGLITYTVASIVTRRIPRLPLGLLILHFVVRLTTALCRVAGVFPDLHQWMDLTAVLLLAWAMTRLAFMFLVELPLFLRNKPALPKITRDFVLLLCYAVLGLVLLRSHGDVNLAGLITTSAVLTAVVGLGAQTTLRSFFSGLSLQLEKPFETGDWIRVGEYEGKVIAISWKATRILTRDNTAVYIPNEDLLAGKSINYSKPEPEFICKIRIGLEYGAPPNKIREVLLDVVRRHPEAVTVPPPEVRLTGFGDFAINYEIRFLCKDFGAAERVKAEINTQIWYALKRNDITIPFPIREISFPHLERVHQAKVAAETQAVIEEELSRVPIMAALSAEERNLLASRVRVLPFGLGETVVWEGEQGDSMYIIHTGGCEILKEDGHGSSNRVAVIQKGDFFGEMSLLTGEKRTATVRAIEDSQFIFIDKPLFAEMISSKPEIASFLAEVLAKRQQQLDAHVGPSAPNISAATSLTARIRSFFNIRNIR
jgi:small-conductance mechanosensitive channel/CRP-like cAMP-binding protein